MNKIGARRGTGPRNRKINRPTRRSMTIAAAAALIAASSLSGISCASTPELGVSRVRRFELSVPADAPSPVLSRPYRIAFVSDIHLGNNFSNERFRRLVNAINAEGPDCVLIGGDNTLGWMNIEDFAREASRLSAPDGVYATLGNHDFYNGRGRTIETLRAANVTVLQDTLVRLPSGPVIAGIGDFRDTFPSMAHFRDILSAEAFTILISHNPDFAEKMDRADLGLFDLIVSGHTHGGQITFFGYAPVLPSEYGQKYRSGWVMKDEVPVIVSNGAGFGGRFLRFRVGAPSEFLLITLKNEH